MKTYTTVLFCLALSAIAAAQWNGDPKINTPICANGAFNVALSSTGATGILRLHDGSYLVGREEFTNIRKDTLPYHNDPNYELHELAIFLHRIDKNGVSQWGPDGVNVFRSNGLIEDYGNWTSSDIRCDRLGNMFVLWSSDSNRMYGNKIDMDGNLLWGPSGSSIFDFKQYYAHSVIFAVDETGGIHCSGNNSIRSVKAQKISVDGTTCFGQSGITIDFDNAPLTVHSAFCFADYRGGAYVGYYRSDDKFFHVQRVDSEGTLLWSQGGVVIGNYSDYYLATDPYTFALSSNERGILELSNWSNSNNFFFQQYDTNGVALWDSTKTAFTFPGGVGQETFPIILDGSRNAFIAGAGYETTATGGHRTKIYAQKINAQGLPQWGSQGMSTASIIDTGQTLTSGNRRQLVSLTSDSAGGAIIAWDSDWHEGKRGIRHIYAQRVRADGALLWGSEGAPVCLADSGQKFPGIAADGSGGAVIVWQDFRNGGSLANRSDIYCAHIKPDGGLPVQLAAFTARLAEQTIRLEWTTASELNNAGFIIERSASEDGPWERIGFQSGHGSSAQTHEYTYDDPLTQSLRALQVAYYRLRQQDFDGAEQLSRIAKVQINAPQSLELFAPYPNPVTKKSVISFSIKSTGRVCLSVYDMLGRCVRILVDENRDSGVYDVPFDAGSLEDGSFFIRLDAGGDRIVRQIYVLK